MTNFSCSKSLTILLLAVFLSACSGTRPAYLGTVQTEILPCPSSPNCVSSLPVEDQDHLIDALSTDDFTTIHQELLQIIVNDSAATLIVDSDQYIYAEYTSDLMRYVDDVEFLFDEEQQKVNVRSASRVGHSDFGVNRERIENIRRQLTAKDQ